MVLKEGKGKRILLVAQLVISQPEKNRGSYMPRGKRTDISVPHKQLGLREEKKIQHKFSLTSFFRIHYSDCKRKGSLSIIMLQAKRPYFPLIKMRISRLLLLQKAPNTS